MDYTAAGLTGTIFDIRRYAIHDGPGIRTTVFLKGCPLTCAWCHNPESQLEAPEVIFRETRCVHCGACVTACPQNALSFQAELPVRNLERCTNCGTCCAVCPTQARQWAGRSMTIAEVMAVLRRDVAFYDEFGRWCHLLGR